jgi:hypothetical protein
MNKELGLLCIFFDYGYIYIDGDVRTFMLGNFVQNSCGLEPHAPIHSINKHTVLAISLRLVQLCR